MICNLVLAAITVLVQQDVVSAQFTMIPSTTTAAELWNPYTWFWPYAIASAESYRDYFSKAQKATNELYMQIYATNANPLITGNWGGVSAAKKPEDILNQNNSTQNNQNQNQNNTNTKPEQKPEDNANQNNSNQSNQNQNNTNTKPEQKPEDNANQNNSNQSNQNQNNTDNNQKPEETNQQDKGEQSSTNEGQSNNTTQT